MEKGTNPGIVTDLSVYDYVHFDYWTAAATQVRFILIEDDGGVTEFFYELPTLEAFVIEEWTHVEIPLSFFENLGFNKTKFFQYKLGTMSDLDVGIVYFDNIYFSINQLSVSEFDTTNFKVYPNPSNNFWTIEANSQITNISLYDVLGKEIYSSFPNSNEAKVNASNLIKGVYFAKISTNKGVQTIKLVKN